MPRQKRKKNSPVAESSSEQMEEAPIYFLNPSAVSKHLYCTVCQDVFQEPQRAPCGHSFCKKCIREWLKNDKSCPIDRKKLLVADLHHDFILENIIGDQKVACQYRWNGCDHVGQLEHLSVHKRNCTYNPENMPGFLRDHMKKNLGSPLGNPGNIDSDAETLPDAATPPLRMRLFAADEEKRQQLCNMFSESTTATALSQDEGSSNVSEPTTTSTSPKKSKRSPRKIGKSSRAKTESKGRSSAVTSGVNNGATSSNSRTTTDHSSSDET